MGSDPARFLGVGILITPHLCSPPLTTVRSDAEIAAGIICGCAPTVPAFFRHVVQGKPCFSSRRRVNEYQTSQNYRKSKELSPTNSGPSVTSPRTIVAPWEDTYVNPRILQGSYLELEDKGVVSDSKFIGTLREMESNDIADKCHIREVNDRDLESGLSGKAQR